MTTLADIAREGQVRLHDEDPDLAHLLDREAARQHDVLMMVAASSVADPGVLACAGSPLINVTTEGYPGARFHAGCEVVDEVERLAVERAKQLFCAQYANVQPHSGSSANAIVMFNLLRPGDTLLGMGLDQGGHLTHGARASVTGNYFKAVSYGLDDRGRIDFDQVARLAATHRPKLIICGASSYPRRIDFARFRSIADDVGAYLLADISHIAGLVAADEHPSPIDHAHFTTTSTYKQLFGPRGGLILMGRDACTLGPDDKPLSRMVQRACFPYFQGTPNLAAVAAKAHALGRARRPRFRATMRRIVEQAALVSRFFAEHDYRVLTGGTDNHMVLLDVGARGLTGVIAERALEQCGIIVNKNQIPGDSRGARVTSGVRLGTNTIALRGLDDDAVRQCSQWIHDVLEAVEPEGQKGYRLAPSLSGEARAAVSELCRRFPLVGYPP